MRIRLNRAVKRTDANTIAEGEVGHSGPRHGRQTGGETKSFRCKGLFDKTERSRPDDVMISADVREGGDVVVEHKDIDLEEPHVEKEMVVETARKDELTER